MCCATRCACLGASPCGKGASGGESLEREWEVTEGWGVPVGLGYGWGREQRSTGRGRRGGSVSEDV